jgi:hypothetical protein
MGVACLTGDNPLVNVNVTPRISNAFLWSMSHALHRNLAQSIGRLEWSIKGFLPGSRSSLRRLLDAQGCHMEVGD